MKGEISRSSCPLQPARASRLSDQDRIGRFVRGVFLTHLSDFARFDSSAREAPRGGRPRAFGLLYCVRSAQESMPAQFALLHIA